ncbi:MAG: SUMF1/EgtB/PvdO family nonheme iron enzyme [Planctomycetes bacterium]|nr:SUMF1/EgtB/PvdO family nonheme iron enzyme [Planctomycetota bacterium]
MSYRRVDKGDHISEYTLLEKLGEGGFGEVWKAEHSQIPGKFVAIKIPTRPESMDLLHKEAVFQHQLEHPNIVRTIGLDTQHDPPYFMMEYVEGKNLRQFMQQEGISPPPYAIDIAVQVLEALAYAHGRGIIHKDIKPENILVERKRITVAEKAKALLHYVKITDLGLGKIPDTGRADITLSENSRTTGVRVLTGTLFYSAPEQMVPGRASDARSDIYSVGVVLYEMLTGELPLGMDLPSELNPVVTAHLDHVCKKALSIDPDQRYQSARQMIEDLVRAKEDFLIRLTASGAPRPGAHPASAVKVEPPHGVGMPLPRSSTAVRLFEWTLLIFVILLLGGATLAYLKVRRSLSRETARENAAEQPLAGPIRFETSPAGAAVLVDGDKRLITPGEASLTFERHQVLVSKDYYETRLLALEPRIVDNRRFFALMDERGKTEIARLPCEEGCAFDRLDLTRQRGRLTICTPDLAPVAVHLNGEPVGMTPYEDEVPAGLHTVRLTKEGYRPFEFEVKVASGAPVVRELSLAPDGQGNPSGGAHAVTISTQPPGATLYFDGTAYAEVTPCTVQLPEGVYQLRLELTHHEVWEERITVRGPVTLPYTLVKIRGRVEFDSEPPGADVRLDGRRLGRTPLVDFVEGGAHMAEFSLDGHFRQSTHFAVVDKVQSVQVKVTMQRIPPGSLLVDSEIPGLEVFVDGRSMGRATSGPLRLDPGRHRVRVLNVEREIELDAGAERKQMFALRDLGMTLVPAGAFEFGCNAREARPPDLLARPVELPAFYIDVCEVTNEQYGLFLEHLRRTNDHSRCDSGEGRHKDHAPTWWDAPQMKEFLDPKRPVVGVDYYDAYAYAAWAGKRLPTEEEWEKAARGTDGRRFPWGNEWRDDERRCNWYDFRGEKDGYGEMTAPVGAFEAGRSPYACNDMAGNVWEWTSSYRDYPRTTNRIIRGGCYLDKAAPVWSRDFQPPNQKGIKTVGFRCVVDTR